MAKVKTKAEFKAMTTPELITYLDSLPQATYNAYVDGDTKVRYFIGKFGAYFVKYVKGTDLFFNSTLAQSIMESGYGRSDIATNGNNFAGVKYNKNIHSDYWTSKNGTKWAKWETPEAGVKGHIDVLLANRYKNAIASAKSPEEQIINIVNAGYDPLKTGKQYLKGMKDILARTKKLFTFGKIK